MLLIDSGNSAIKTRLLEAGSSTDRVFPLHDGFEASGFVEYLAGLKLRRVYSASVASGQVQQTLGQIIRAQQPEAEYLQLQTLPQLGCVTNAYQDHRQMGVDRWLTLLAATTLTQQDVIIIDAGSAITIDLMNRDRQHLGGAILPGFNTELPRFRSLFPHVDFDNPAVHETEMPGTSTAACIHLPEVPVTVAMIAQIVERWIKLLQPPVTILLAGQDAGRIADGLGIASQTVADLVFIGMLKQIQLLR